VLGDGLASPGWLKTAQTEKRLWAAAVSVLPMVNRISHTFIHVLDQDEALDFYVGKLGLEVGNDADLGTMRWLTVHPPEQPDVQLVLMKPGPPVYDDTTAEQVRELVAKGAAGGGVIFETDDCRGTYEALRAAGVEFTQEPIERFYGTDCGLRDPFGNPIRITQPPEGPVVVPSPEELEAQL
jgi:catechol 2,3-dioxygenase-like lactoylglutathione lyase family enzyme